jgi:hypothetical protein
MRISLNRMHVKSQIAVTKIYIAKAHLIKKRMRVNWAHAVGGQWGIENKKMKKSAEGTSTRGGPLRSRQNADQLSNRNIYWFFLNCQIA